MKLQPDYKKILICPTTGKEINNFEFLHSYGVCPRCGDVETHSNLCHREKIVGRWMTPSFWEWLCGKRKIFIRKTETDTGISV